MDFVKVSLVDGLTKIRVFLFLLSVQVAWSGEDIAAITTPSADVILSFLQPGRIEKIHVHEGQKVDSGMIVLSQYDLAERTQLAQIEAESNNTSKILAAEATLDQKKMDFKRMEMAGKRGAATELEVEHAKLDVRIAELSLQIAQFEHEQALRKYEEAKVRLAQMSLASPVNGYVEKVDVETGESIQALKDVIRIVRTDPLWIDVHVPLEIASQVTTNHSVQVQFPEPKKTLLEGKVVFIAKAADAASDTLRIRIEVPNKTDRPSGEHVTVSFSDDPTLEKPEPPQK